MTKCIMVLGVATVGMTAFCGDAYIQSSGKQAIDTGYCANPKTALKVDFAYLNTTPQQRIVGSDQVDGDAGQFSFSTYVNGDRYYSWAAKDGVGNWRPFSNKTDPLSKTDIRRRTILLDSLNSKAELATEGESSVISETITTTRTRTSPRTLAIFGNNRGSAGVFAPDATHFASAKLYSLKLWDNGRLAHCFLPYLEDGVGVLKDAVTGGIYRSHNGEYFSFGGDIGVFSGYDADEWGDVVPCGDFQIAEGKLVDTTIPCWRVNAGRIEYRVRFKATRGLLTIAGESSSIIDKWVHYGESATFVVTANDDAGCVFRAWRGDVERISTGDAKTSTVSVMVDGPAELTAFCSDVDDIYSEATCWIRQFADQDANGILDGTDLRSALATALPWNSVVPYNSPVISNEWVATAYRGGKRYQPTLYLAQAVTITNETEKTGYGLINTATLNGFTSGAGIDSDSFTFAIRFRPDNEQFRSDYCWLMSWGYNGKSSGFNLGMYQYGTRTDTFTPPPGVAKEIFTRTYRLTLFKSGQALQLFANTDMVHGNKWHDLIVSFDGTTKMLRYVLCRAPWDPDLHPVSESNASDYGGVMLYQGEVAMTQEEGFSFKPADNLIFGSEGNHSGRAEYANDGIVASNYTKSFRGSIHQFVTWNRSLDFNEMKDALAVPRTDLVRIGTRDGSSAEFRGGSVVDSEAAEWTIPSVYEEGDSATVAFDLDRTGECEMNQVFRWYPTVDSGAGKVRLEINGNDLGEQPVRGDKTSVWIVGRGVLRDGANTLRLTCTQAGLTPLELDAAALGGSVQIGHKDASYMEFCYETKAVADIEMLNGNWRDIRRVYFGSIPDSEGRQNAATNSVFHFTIPHEFSNPNEYSWRLSWKDLSDTPIHMPRWKLNGHELGYSLASDGGYHSISLPQKLLVGGENRLEFYNAGVYAPGKYYSMDYFRMEIFDRKGLLVIFR